MRDYRSVLWTLFAAVGVLLAVGCGNLANLLLLRTAGRQAEFAIRLSLGASRGRLIRHLLGEAMVIAVVSGAAGIGLAAIGLTAWQFWGPANFPRMNETGLNLEIVAFALAVSAVSALACGTVPGEGPVAVSVFPDELYAAPKSWSQQAYPKLVHYNEVPKGGHFAAWEQPALFSREVRAGFKSMR